jgi:hypothetical protein
MSATPAPLLAASAAVTAALETVTRDVAAYQSLSDLVLLDLSRIASQQQKLLNTHAALIAGELARRSAPSLGSAGLAQRTGHRTTEELVRVTTGSTKREAISAVRAGRLAVEAAELPDPATGELVAPERPWLRAVGVALSAGTVSVAAAESICNGLGEPTAEITATVLADAVTELLATAATGMDADRLFRAACDLRNEIDEAGIADRERARFEARALQFRRNPDGTARLVWDMDPETATIAGDLFDRATSPRRGGPRFVDPTRKAASQRILDDTRTTEQLVSDVFLELLRQGAVADTSQLLGTAAPVVTIYVTKETIDKGEGSGRVAGQPEPVSWATIERHICTGGVTDVSFDETGNPLNLEREQRLFTRKQKAVLAAVWGGCAIEGCDRPASWTEAHHIEHYARDHGKTNILNGILLCRHHHLLLHNNGWEIHRQGSNYWLTLPTNVKLDGLPVRLRPKNPTYQQHQRQRAG